MKIIEKPWGIEYIIFTNELYTFKLLLVYKGEKLSKQYHQKKHETLFFSGGKAKITINDKDYYPPAFTDLDGIENKSFIIPPGTIHRIEAITDCLIYEASTSELDDVVRLEDKYDRC